MQKEMQPVTRLLITYFLGLFGVHKFIDGDKKNGFLYLFTAGLFGVGWIHDTVVATVDVIKFYSNNHNKSSATTISNGNPVLSEDGNMYTKLRGVTKDCVNVIGLNRQTALDNLDLNAKVHFQKSESNGCDILLVVTEDGVDLGEISYERSAILINEFADKIKNIKIKNITGGKNGYYFGCNIKIEIK